MSPRDITGRVLGKPLRSPYARGGWPPASRWLWVAGALWLLWVTLLSEHSLWRIARLRRDLASTNAEVRRVRGEKEKLQARRSDPRERAEHAEQILRSQGMARPGELIYRLGAGTDSTQGGWLTR